MLTITVGINGSIMDSYAEYWWPAGQNCYINIRVNYSDYSWSKGHVVLCNSAKQSLSLSVYFNCQQVRQNYLITCYKLPNAYVFCICFGSVFGGGINVCFVAIQDKSVPSQSSSLKKIR